ncbi:MAG: Abi family protein [Pseudomonadota bacterium]
MNYARPWKSFGEQLELLKARGMAVDDEPAAASYLSRIGYYRLSAYWYPFRVWSMLQEAGTGRITHQRTDAFQDGTRFVDAVNLYLFDKKLRLIALDALERIEVALRVDIAYLLGERNTFAHLDPAELHPGFAGKLQRDGRTAHEVWRDRYQQLVARSKEEFVKHYHQKHGRDLPIWVAIEVWDFGTMSQLFAMMQVADKARIAAKYGISDWRVFQSWLRSLSYLRNLVAHHSRLWNRNVVEQPKLPAAGEIAWCDAFAGKTDLLAKSFLLLAICRHMVRRICPGTAWHLRVADHLRSFPEQRVAQPRSVADMGTPPGWESWW